MPESFSRYENIGFKLNANHGFQIVPIWEYSTNFEYEYYKANNFQLIRNIFIRNLKANVVIKNIPEINLEILLDSTLSTSERQLRAYNIEWTSPRIHMNLWTGKSGAEWQLAGTCSLLNRGPSPGYQTDLMPYFTEDLAIILGENGRIGVSLQNVGSGFLTGSDHVTITGSYVEDVTVLPKLEGVIAGCKPSEDIAGIESKQIVLSNTNRTYLVITNKSNIALDESEEPINSHLFLNFGQTAELGKGIYLAPGAIYEYNRTIDRYTGPIAAIADRPGCPISIMECS